MRTKSSIFNRNFVAVKLFAMGNINQYIITQLKRPVDRLKLMAIRNIIKILSTEECNKKTFRRDEDGNVTNIIDWYIYCTPTRKIALL